MKEQRTPSFTPRPKIFDLDGSLSHKISSGGRETSSSQEYLPKEESFQPPTPVPFGVDVKAINEENQRLRRNNDDLLNKVAVLENQLAEIRGFEFEEEEIPMTKFHKIGGARLRTIMNSTSILKDNYRELVGAFQQINKKIEDNNRTSELTLEVHALEDELTEVKKKLEEDTANFNGEKLKLKHEAERLAKENANLEGIFEQIESSAIFTTAKKALETLFSTDGEKDKAIAELNSASELLTELLSSKKTTEDDK